MAPRDPGRWHPEPWGADREPPPSATSSAGGATAVSAPGLVAVIDRFKGFVTSLPFEGEPEAAPRAGTADLDDTLSHG